MTQGEMPRGTDAIVAEALRIDVTVACNLPSFDPRLEEMPSRQARGTRRGRYVKADVLDAELAPLVQDALAGVPDAQLARRAGRSVGQVREWRRRCGIRGRIGRATTDTKAAYMIAGLIEPTVPVVHMVSPVGGTWSPPEYVLREPIAYTQFARLCYLVVTDLGYASPEIATAIGFREQDVVAAIALYEERGRS